MNEIIELEMNIISHVSFSDTLSFQSTNYCLSQISLFIELNLSYVYLSAKPDKIILINHLDTRLFRWSY